LELFREGLAPKILFSVSRFEIRRFSKMSLPAPLDLLTLSSSVPPAQRHFFVLFEGPNVQVIYVKPQRFGTLTEIESLAHWLASHQDVRSVLLISSSSHLRRVGICCRSLLGGDLEVILKAPPAQPHSAEKPGPLTAAFLESLKTFAYWVVLALRRGRPRTNPITLREKP
jgi:uncharacterized SAM-binding protein YcdF (DUF218 family)